MDYYKHTQNLQNGSFVVVFGFAQCISSSGKYILPRTFLLSSIGRTFNNSIFTEDLDMRVTSH